MLKNKTDIKNWLDTMQIENYTINDDFTVAVDGNVNLSAKKITNIPVQFGIVKGYFYCSYNVLTSLIGCPKSVEGHFYCHVNKLTNLQGCPESIGHNFICNNNQLTTLKHSPQSIGGNFNCGYNKLATLEGIPKAIWGDFNCSFNVLISLQDSPKSVGGHFVCNGNPIKDIDLKTFDSTFNGIFYHKGSIIESFAEFYIDGQLSLTYKEIENIKLNNKLNDIIKNKTETINSINKNKL